MAQSHVVRESVHGATVDRSQIRGEKHAVPDGILLEKQQLRVVRKGCGVVQIDIYKVIIALANGVKERIRSKRSRSLPSF